MATASDADAFGPLLAAVAPLAAPFRARGHQLHLVGGSVRDALLGVVHEGDLDLTTDARPEQTLDIVSGLTDKVWTQGQRFGTIGADIDGRLFEITTHRTERYEPSSRKPQVAFADALEEDLARRDFTVNALAVSVETGELVDPYGGRSDLTGGILRTPLEPEISFVDDPLRMLRAGRFVARFGLTAVGDLVDAAVEHAARIEIVSAERILDELTKLLSLPRPGVGVDFLSAVGLLERVLPGADPGALIDAMAVDPAVRFAGLLHGLGAAAAGRRMRELRASNDTTDTVRALVGALDALPEVPVAPPDVRRWVAIAPAWRDALDLAAVLAPGRAGALRAGIDDLARSEDLDDQSLPVDGDDVMRELGLSGGPEVGAALRRLRDLRLERGPLSRQQALDELRSGR